MRIAHVTLGYPPDLGGIERVVFELAARTTTEGHRVEVLCHASPAEPLGTQHHDGVVVRRFQVPIPSANLAFSAGLLGHLARRRDHFDVVHSHNYHASPAASAALAGARPLVCSPYYHGGGHMRGATLAYALYRPIGRYILSACARVVCASTAEADTLVKDFPRIAGRVAVVPLGVETEAFAYAQRFEESTGTLVVAAGRMEAYKQFDRVVAAAAELPAGHELVLIGDGPERPQIEQLIRQRDLEAVVRCVGRVSDVELRRWFRTASVLVSMSRLESFGLTLAEGLAARARVVASDIPAHRAIADAQPAGAVRLVAVDASPAQIAAAIVSASSDSRPFSPELSTWDDTAHGVLEIYEEVVRSS